MQRAFVSASKKTCVNISFPATRLHQAQDSLNESARYQQLVELSPDAIIVYRGNKLALLNRAGSRLLGAEEPHQLLGRSIFEFIHPNYHTLFQEHLRLRQASNSSTPFMEQVWLREDGSEFHAEIASTHLIYDNAPAVQVVVRDISERKQAEALQLGQNRILNMMATGAALPEILMEITRFAENQCENALCSIQLLNSQGTMLGEHIASNLPRSYIERLGPVEVGASHGSCGTAVFRAEPVIVTNIAKDRLWATQRNLALEHELRACSSWPIFSRDRKILGTVAFYFRETLAPTTKNMQLFDICAGLAGIAIESRTSEEKIRYLAHYDGLTSLPNRFLFKEYFDLALRNARRHEQKFAVLFLDLDGFKKINDTFGHDAGDHVLREIAKRLRNCLRGTDKIARIGGDEFYVLIEELSDGCYAAEVAQKLLDEALRPVHIGERECRLGVSIGISIYPTDGCDEQTLIKNADSAMYRAKNLGKNTYQFFSPPTQAEEKRTVILGQHLSRICRMPALKMSEQNKTAHAFAVGGLEMHG